MSRDRAIVVRASDARRLSLGSMELAFHAGDDESEGAYALAFVTAGPSEPGTTPHVHREHDDVTFVIEGALTFDVAGETFEAPARTLVIVPRGLSHRWWNAREENATFLNIHVPGFGFETLVHGLVGASREGMAELGARHDTFFDRDALAARYDR